MLETATDEKVLPRSRRFNAVGFFLTATRIWQWSSSFFVYGSFSLLYAHVQENKLGGNSRMRAVEILGLISLIYTTLIICGVHVLKTLGLRSWRIFAITSFAGDVTIMGLCIAKITILSFSGLPADCHGLTSDEYNDNDLVRQPAAGFSTIRFGSGATAMTGELDRWCTFPRTVYGLTVLAIFSYTLSMLLSVLYLQQSTRDAPHSEKCDYFPNSPRRSLRCLVDRRLTLIHTPALVDFDRDSGRVSHGSSSQHNASRIAPCQGATRSTRTLSTSSYSSSCGGITLESSDTESVRSLSPSVISSCGLGSSSAPQRRWSTSTSSSFNANAFIVTDGFRPMPNEDMLPAYESRPGSLYNETMKYPAGLGVPGIRKP